MSYCSIELTELPASNANTGYRPAVYKKLFGSAGVKRVLPFTRSEFFQTGRKKAQGMSISGVQEKLSLMVVDKQLMPTVIEGEFILKPSPEAYPFAAENEHAAMSLSRVLGIPTALCGLVTFKDGQNAYITRRFDRDGGSKIHQEDMAQVMGLKSAEKYETTYEEMGRAILDATDGKQSPVVDFIRRVIFSFVIGNNDLHAKNISMYRLRDNRSGYLDKLTLNYDVLFISALGTQEGGEEPEREMALGLLHETDGAAGDEFFSEHYERHGYYTGYDFLELATRLGINTSPVESFIKKLDKETAAACSIISASYMPAAMKQATIETYRSGVRAMLVR